MFKYNFLIDYANKLSFDERQGFYGILHYLGEIFNDKELMETAEVLIESTLSEERLPKKQEGMLEKYLKQSA